MLLSIRPAHSILAFLILLFMDQIGVRMSANTAAATSRRHRSKGIQWWNLANTQYTASEDPLHPDNQLFLTPPIHPLSRKQQKLVTKNPGTIVAISKAAKMAIEECQHQFRHRRWNCPTSDSDHGGSVFGKILKKGCRETAFVYAITAAALVHSTARACSEGSIYTCTCGKLQQPDGALSPQRQRITRSEWQWGGCSDNTEFGYKFSRDFIDGNEKERDLRCAMNLHNNEAGRLHVTTEIRQECKCHGMSGSCAIKTCWMRLPTFRQVGDSIKDRFDGASKIDQGNDIRERARFNLIPADPSHKPPVQTDLVYFEESPTFCDPDNAVAFRGIKGRECNATSMGIDGCDLMCCGRGYKTEKYQARERCNCVFHWCCKVTCETCVRMKDRHMCL